MIKNATEELGRFVDEHPTTAVADLLTVLSGTTADGTCDRDLVTAYLLKVADSEGIPESIRVVALQLYKEWDLEAVSASAVAMLSLGNLLH